MPVSYRGQQAIACRPPPLPTTKLALRTTWTKPTQGRATEVGGHGDDGSDSPHDGGIGLLVVEARTLLPRILETASVAGASVSGVEIVEPDLEAVFLHLTGRALRD